MDDRVSSISELLDEMSQDETISKDDMMSFLTSIRDIVEHKIEELEYSDHGDDLHIEGDD